jgi:hypothetical protein
MSEEESERQMTEGEIQTLWKEHIVYKIDLKWIMLTSVLGH